VKTAGACNNKILISVSSNGGASFTGGAGGADPRTQTTVDTPAQAGTDQFWQWAAFNHRGQLVVSYYDRRYGNDEWTGSSDMSLSVSSDERSFITSRVSTSPSPAESEFSGLFNGDYTGLAVTGTSAYPIWTDTRDLDLVLCSHTGRRKAPPSVCTFSAPNAHPANDENVYTARVALP